MSRTNDGTWIQTFSGKPFWPNDPRPSDVDIHDIAHSLALSCRWTGHVRKHYSVGQHSVLVSLRVPREDALAALLHDASEAYISDIARPTKGQLANYYEIEARLMAAILHRFGLPGVLPQSVKVADDILLFSEARDLMLPPPMPWTYVPKGESLWPSKIRPWPMWWTEIRFLWRFAQLTDTRWETAKQYVKNKLRHLFNRGIDYQLAQA